LYLLLKEEEDPNEEPMPPNPAYESLVQMNREIRKALDEGEPRKSKQRA
jgi:hypothetical protein